MKEKQEAALIIEISKPYGAWPYCIDVQLKDWATERVALEDTDLDKTLEITPQGCKRIEDHLLAMGYFGSVEWS